MYIYEVWLDGNCLRSSEEADMNFYTEVEAEDEAVNEVEELLYEEGYYEDGYDADDFEIVTKVA